MSAQTLRPASDTINAACALLGQLDVLVQSTDDDAYTAPCTAMGGGSIGAHVRHTLDHFCAALKGLNGDTVDYDHRDRGTDVQTSTDAARTEIARVVEHLGAINHADVDKAMTIRVMLTGDGACTELKTSVARELAFATHHAVHHNAMINAICGMGGVCTPDGFGKAPSTIDHERRA